LNCPKPRAQARQQHIEHYGVIVVTLGLVKPIVTRFSGIDRVTFLAQRFGKIAKQARLILDDQDSHRNAWVSIMHAWSGHVF
jgi:hypothetical protein